MPSPPSTPAEATDSQAPAFSGLRSAFVWPPLFPGDRPRGQFDQFARSAPHREPAAGSLNTNRQMKTITLITMRWPEYDEPVCAGSNKCMLREEALWILRAQHGTGCVPRPGAMCSLPIRHDDLREWKIPLY